MTDARPLDVFAELCFHGLAHVPMDDVGSSFDPAYLAWALTIGVSDRDALTDGETIARTIRPDSRGLLHAWHGLHRDLARFAAARRMALAELHDADVDEPRMLAAIHRAADPALEIMHAMLGLALPQWMRVHAEHIAPALQTACARLQPIFAAAYHRVPSLEAQRIELSWVLGPRGRAHPERIIVGAPAPWHGGSDAQSVVLALHEHAVHDLADGDWVDVEWSALRRVAGWLAGRGDALADAHATWVRMLDLRALVDGVRARGGIDSHMAIRLRDDAAGRPALLAELDLDQSTTGR